MSKKERMSKLSETLSNHQYKVVDIEHLRKKREERDFQKIRETVSRVARNIDW